MAYHKSTKDFGKMLDNGITDEWKQNSEFRIFLCGKNLKLYTNYMV